MLMIPFSLVLFQNALLARAGLAYSHSSFVIQHIMGALTSKNPMGSSGALPRQIPNTFMRVAVIMGIAQKNAKSLTEYLRVGLNSENEKYNAL